VTQEPEEGKLVFFGKRVYICSVLQDFVEGPKAPQLLYMNVENILDEIVSGVLASNPAVFIVEVKHGKKQHEYILDGDKPLGIYDIADLSREINKLADEQMPEENYNLEIASPGADSPIRLFRQLPKHVGRTFEVELNDESIFSGKLEKAEDGMLTFSIIPEKKKKGQEAQILEIPFQNIKKAHIIISFK